MAAGAQERLTAHGHQEFRISAAEFAGGTGAVLDFVNPRSSGAAPYHSRQYFTVRGPAAFALATGSADWAAYLPLAQELARRFELVDGHSAVG